MGLELGLPTLVIASILALGSASLWQRKRWSPVSNPLPPGPPPLPFVGNVLDIVKSEPWKLYVNLGKKYCIFQVIHIWSFVHVNVCSR